ncbi:MAG: hypothetical protein ABFR75_12860 [Acidobacteriota bacterium]
MKILLKVKFKSLVNTIKNSSSRKYILFLLFGILIFALLSVISVKVFGYIYNQSDFTLPLKYFLAEKLLTMVFLTMYTMLILSSLISTLNIFFLSKDLNLLFSSPIPPGKIFFWKGIEVLINSSAMVVFFSLPVLFSYFYYFSPSSGNIILSILSFLLFIISGVLLGITTGFIIPGFISVKRLQPALSVTSILLISFVVIFIRMLQPEKFGNPDIIDNVLEYIGSFSTPFFKHFPFHWLSNSMISISKGGYSDYLNFGIYFLILISVFILILWYFQKRFYFKLFDKLKRGISGGRKTSTWKKRLIKGDYGTLLNKELKSFLRTPEQWSQLLVIGAIIVVFIMNMKVIPLPSPQIKNFIAYMNIGMAAFIVTGLNSRFTFTSIPMENPGIVHILASPFDRRKILKFKLIFYMIPMMALAFFLFFTGEITLKLDRIARISGIIYLVPAVFFITLMAFFFSLRIKGSKALSPQHLIVSREGISFMLWSMIYIGLSIMYMIRPLYIYFFHKFTGKEIPYGEITLWIAGFFLINFLIISYFYRNMRKEWREKEFL